MEQPPDTVTSAMVRIACIQYQLDAVASFDDFSRKVTTLVDRAANQQCDFILFPEFFTLELLSTCANRPDQEGVLQIARHYTAPFIDLMSSLSTRHGLHIIAGSHPAEEDDKLLNKSFIFAPDGDHVAQPKLQITPFEKNDWNIRGGNQLVVVTTPKAKFAVQICYDVEFPAATCCLADEGIDILFVPYCTDDRAGMLRVRYCAQARAVEHQIYVASAGLVGGLPEIESMAAHYGESTVHTPSDTGFATDGIAAIAEPNVEAILVTELNIAALRQNRDVGTVTPTLDRRRDLFSVQPNPENLAVIHRP